MAKKGKKERYMVVAYTKQLMQFGNDEFHSKKKARRFAKLLKKAGFYTAVRKYNERTYEWK